MLNHADNLRRRLIGLPRHFKRAIQISADIVLIWFALWLSFVIRIGDFSGVDPFGGHLWLFLLTPLISVPIFIRMGMYRAVLRYFGDDALRGIFKAISLSVLFLALVVYLYRETPIVVPRSMVFIYWCLSLMLLGGLRLLMRQYFMGGWFSARGVNRHKAHQQGLKHVAIFGAGAAGNQLLAALRMGRTTIPVAFIDDDQSIDGLVIAGLKVYSSSRIKQMIDDTQAEELLLAIPSASRSRRREILELLGQYGLHVRSVPSFMDLASGRVRVEDVQEVDVADLLGRDPVPPQKTLFERCILDQVVLVTGAGGSIGSELCRQILFNKPKILLLFEHSEFNLYSVHSELLTRIDSVSQSTKLIPILGSVRDSARLDDVMSSWCVDTVYHAAAYKHVPMVEHNISEGVINNVFGTLFTAQAAIKFGVKNFVLISTDKAVRPTNVMGATKRLAEMVLQALSHEESPILWGEGERCSIKKTRFTMVRFGNVLGSSGSVIPLFNSQIHRGGPVTVTHPNITRYFMTIQEAAQLVIQAGSMGEGGDVFVLDMGQPVKITELAEKLIKLSGLTVRSKEHPFGDVAIEYSGLRPGEKLYEELLIGDNVSPTEHPKIMRANEEMLPWSEYRQLLQVLHDGVVNEALDEVRSVLLDVVSGYCFDGEIVDFVYRQRRSKV